MASKKNNKRRDNSNDRINNIDNKNKIEEKDEADEILEQLDRMEKMKAQSGEGQNVDISSKVRDLIKGDKEAIRQYNDVVNTDDELDYLDDETFDDMGEVYVKNDGNKDQTSEKNTSNKADSDNESKNKKDSTDEKSEGADESKDEKSDKGSVKTEDNKKKKNNKSKKKTASTSENSKKSDNESADEQKDELGNLEKDKDDNEMDINLDFFASMERKEKERKATMLRKQQPNKLRDADADHLKRVIRFFAEDTKNMVIGVTIIALLVVLFVALIVTNHNSAKTENEIVISKEFANVDDAKKQAAIDKINEYYDAVETQDTGKIKELVYNGDKLSTENCLKLIEEQAALTVFMDSDKLSSPFEITDCKFIDGRKNDEYVVLTKYQFTIDGCTEAVPGIVLWYLVDVSKDSTPDFRISTEIQDTTSEVCKYVSEVTKQKKISKEFDTVNQELVSACEKDEVLRKFIFDMYEDMINNNSNIDADFRSIIAELKDFEEAETSSETESESGSEAKEDSTEEKDESKDDDSTKDDDSKDESSSETTEKAEDN